jgi:hypothetical protein
MTTSAAMAGPKSRYIVPPSPKKWVCNKNLVLLNYRWNQRDTLRLFLTFCGCTIPIANGQPFAQSRGKQRFMCLLRSIGVVNMQKISQEVLNIYPYGQIDYHFDRVSLTDRTSCGAARLSPAVSARLRDPAAWPPSQPREPCEMVVKTLQGGQKPPHAASPKQDLKQLRSQR